MLHPCLNIVHKLHCCVVEENKISIENLTLDRSSLLRFGEHQDIKGRVGQVGSAGQGSVKMGVRQIEKVVALLVEEISLFISLPARHNSNCSPIQGNSLFGRKVHEADHPVCNLDNWATVLENITIVPWAPSKVRFANVNNQDLEQLLLSQRAPGTGNPHQNATDNSLKLQ